MSDLISRQEVIDAILECCSSDVDNEYECGYEDGLRQGVHRIKNLPSADAVPVKHGKWCYGSEIAREHRADGVHIYYEKCFCSICGYEENYKPYWNYCPNCGAKMDGGKDDV